MLDVSFSKTTQIGTMDGAIIHRIASDALAITGCRRYAVIGGGLAGVATAWHLLRLATPSSPIQLDLFDPAGEQLSSCCKQPHLRAASCGQLRL